MHFGHRFDPTRWDPFKELEEISERFNRVFGRLPARRESSRGPLTVVGRAASNGCSSKVQDAISERP